MILGREAGVSTKQTEQKPKSSEHPDGNDEQDDIPRRGIVAEWTVTIILLLFGNRLPSLMRSLGQGIVEFKKGVKGIEDDHKPPPIEKPEYDRKPPPIKKSQSE